MFLIYRHPESRHVLFLYGCDKQVSPPGIPVNVLAVVVEELCWYPLGRLHELHGARICFSL